MRNHILALVFTAVVGSALAFAPKPALAVVNIWTGKVVHVSTENIKVWNPEGNTTLSFLLVPKFDEVFSDEGNTTEQMEHVKPGTWVTIYYDQKALGARHADKIIILHGGTQIKS